MPFAFFSNINKNSVEICEKYGIIVLVDLLKKVSVFMITLDDIKNNVSNLSSKLESLEIDDDTYLKLTSKYGEERVNEYFNN